MLKKWEKKELISAGGFASVLEQLERIELIYSICDIEDNDLEEIYTELLEQKEKANIICRNLFTFLENALMAGKLKEFYINCQERITDDDYLESIGINPYTDYEAINSVNDMIKERIDELDK